MVITKIKRDEKGLFVYCDGCVGRYSEPYKAIYGETKFKEGNKVSCTHPAGGTIFVKSKPDRKEQPECWDIENG